MALNSATEAREESWTSRLGSFLGVRERSFVDTCAAVPHSSTEPVDNFVGNAVESSARPRK